MRKAGRAIARQKTVGHRKAEVRTAEVENPYFARAHREGPTNPKTITAYINVRESAVETLFARGGLDKAQKKAADRFRSIWEAMGGAGASAMDYTHEMVDGGGAIDPINSRQIDAGKELSRCRHLLGARIYELVCKVCGEGLALIEVSPDKRERLTAADNLRSGLTDLAEMWGLLRRSERTR